MARTPNQQRSASRNRRSKPPPPMPEHVAAWLSSALDKSVAGMVLEFRALRAHKVDPCPTDAFNAAPAKNRYRDVNCLDTTRVILKPLVTDTASTTQTKSLASEVASADYIHANYVSGSRHPQQFICTQGPLGTTVPDFWRMVVQERVPMIVMLCEVVEKGKPKCEQYWPLQANTQETYGPFTVVNTGVTSERLKLAHFAKVTNLEVRVTAGGQAWPVQHWQWAEWPDRGVPPHTGAVIALRTHALRCGHPIVVHCSAGIGRTGTLVAVDLLLGGIERGKDGLTDVAEIMRQIRAQRLHSVQNESQYVFIHRVVVDYIVHKYRIVPSKNARLKEFYDKHAVLLQATRQ